MFRHGDVLILDARPLRDGAKKLATNVVAEGEATGHAHRLVGGEVWETEDGSLAVVAGDKAAMTHEEHNRLELPASKAGEAYPITIQREYDDEKEWRQVSD